ncbi:helix-turn-helix domain-containing protein [Amycolatopsis sp. NPDC051716]|uniref:helix-turn-helix domain-containing protein n=1 Tax=Amycolatopsis sp. NPDC051716 TaxID=3155804 RepID=UPI0034426A7D
MNSETDRKGTGGAVEKADLHTVAETAQRLRCSVPTVRRLMKSGELAVTRIGHGRGLPRIPDVAITAYLKRHTTCCTTS